MHCSNNHNNNHLIYDGHIYCIVYASWSSSSVAVAAAAAHCKNDQGNTIANSHDDGRHSI